MNDFYVSYLMGTENINDDDLLNIGIYIESKSAKGDFSLKIPKDNIDQYIDLVKNKLRTGFWNDIVGKDEIIFLFKFKDSSIKEFRLPTSNELEIVKLCSDFSNTPLDDIPNIYKYLSDNKFYYNFMLENYKDKIGRTPS